MRINDFLTGLFLGVGITLVDFKLEFGRLWENEEMRIVLADEISPDNCRLWDARTNERLGRQDLHGLPVAAALALLACVVGLVAHGPVRHIAFAAAIVAAFCAFMLLFGSGAFSGGVLALWEARGDRARLARARAAIASDPEYAAAARNQRPLVRRWPAPAAAVAVGFAAYLQLGGNLALAIVVALGTTALIAWRARR